MDFQKFIDYCSSKRGVFSNYDEARTAFLIHQIREENSIEDPLVTKRNLLRKAIYGRKRPKNNYSFSDVYDFLKKSHLLGKQVYDSRNICGDEMEIVYHHDGVTIEYCYGWNYIGILGLKPEDFNKIKAAESIFSDEE